MPPVLTHAEAVVNIAHRGASAVAPENTLAAFARAAELGADAVELDVRCTSDGHLVVVHDGTLGRTTDVARVFPDRAAAPVHAFTLAELRRLDAGAWFGAGGRGERVPTLAAAMDLLAGLDRGLLVEVKDPAGYPGIATAIVDQLRAAGPRWRRQLAAGLLTVESFDWAFVQALRSTAPRVPVGLLGAPPVAALPGLAGFADAINPNAADVTAEYVERVHQLGMAVNVWTVDDPAELSGVVAAGVDGVISNRPDRVAAALRVAVSATAPAAVG